MRPGSGAPIIPGVMALVGRLAAEDAARNGGLPLLDSFRVKDAPFAEKVKNEEAYYIVESINQYHYQHVPWEVMQHDGESRLTLITCLGDFSSSAGTSMHRVVAVCRPYTGE